jgi:ABC-type lipoprotein release transport system permease subunit
MKMTLFLAFRNFIRQKRRNVLLGGAIAFGIMMLTVAFAFTEGLTDTILNRIVIYMSGHMSVSVVEKGRMMSPIIRDREEMVAKITDSVEGVIHVEDAIGTFCRVIGNGKGDYTYMVGLNLDQSFKDSFQLKEGSFDSFSRRDIQPVFISEEKAKALKVKMGDVLNARFINVNGQNNTGTLTIVGILKSQSMWMDFATFTPKVQLKALLGYRPYETGVIQLKLKNPKSAAKQAELLWKNLKPNPAYIDTGKVCFVSSKTQSGAISDVFAKAHQLRVGDKLEMPYPTKFEGIATTNFIVEKIIAYPNGISSDVIWINRDKFFAQYNYALPKNARPISDYISDKKIIETVATQWIRLKRARTTDEFTHAQKDIQKNPITQPVMSVGSMYEVASHVVSMETVLNLVALIGASILLFIIMVGVINSLRMTIRERTHEIGTMRALGMNKSDIKKIFLWESLLLALSGWIVGLILAFIVMKALSSIQFGADNPMNMVMVDRHIYFIPTLGHAIQNLVLLLVFMLITSYFPARRAASLSPAVAFKQTKG